MRLEHEAAPVGVDQRVALAPLDLLARIVAAGATSLGHLDALAVDNRAARAGLASDPLAIGHDQRVIDLLKETVVAELGEPTIDRAPRWQIAWQQAPRAASGRVPRGGVAGWRLVIGALLLEQNDEWAVQRTRYMTLETISQMSEDPLVSLPAVAR